MVGLVRLVNVLAKIKAEHQSSKEGETKCQRLKDPPVKPPNRGEVVGKAVKPPETAINQHPEPNAGKAAECDLREGGEA